MVRSKKESESMKQQPFGDSGLVAVRSDESASSVVRHPLSVLLSATCGGVTRALVGGASGRGRGRGGGSGSERGAAGKAQPNLEASKPNASASGDQLWALRNWELGAGKLPVPVQCRDHSWWLVGRSRRAIFFVCVIYINQPAFLTESTHCSPFH